MKQKRESLSFALGQLLAESEQGPLTVGRICQILAGRGYAVLLILFSFPFCFPITIPGSSTPFGLLLAFLGLRLAFGQKLWWPEWILNKQVPSKTLKTIIDKIQKIVQRLQKILHPRLPSLVSSPVAHHVHGVLICLLGLLLCIPLPIPFTNTFAALPIFFLGLGLLEDDGIAVMIAYALAIFCFGFFGFLFWLGGVQWQKIATLWS